jgi:hypothetical protein
MPLHVLYSPARSDFVRDASGKPVVTEKKGPTRADEVCLLLVLIPPYTYSLKPHLIASMQFHFVSALLLVHRWFASSFLCRISLVLIPYVRASCAT